MFKGLLLGSFQCYVSDIVSMSGVACSYSSTQDTSALFQKLSIACDNPASFAPRLQSAEKECRLGHSLLATWMLE